MTTAVGDSVLVSFLAGRDVGCPGCGYNLRDGVGDRCPECGDELSLRLGLTEPRQGTLIAGLVGLSAGAGLSGLLLIYIGLQTLLVRNMGPFAWRFVFVTGAGLVVEGAAVAAWLAGWRRIRRGRRSVRAVLMICCWGLTLTNLAVFTVVIR